MTVGQIVTPLDPDRILALSYVPARRRAAVEALWQLDAALGAVIAGSKEPMISRIKLVWWRDALERLDRYPAPAEPVLQGVARHILPAGISGAELSAMEAAWTILLSPDPLSAADLEGYAARGRLLFGLSARLLGGNDAGVERAGEGWALADLARHSGDDDDGRAALAAAKDGLAGAEGRWPSALRPLGMLAMLARRDVESGPGVFEPRGSPARMLRMLRHRLTGR